MKILNLIIVGNGFDIAHGIQSRYSDFCNYLCSFESPPKIRFPDFPDMFDANSISSEDKKKRNLMRQLVKYIPREDLWNGFEYALGNLDYDQLMEDNSDFLLGYGDENWRDSANYDFQYMIQEELSFTEDINYQLQRWIGSLNTLVQPLESIDKILNACSDSSTLYLNFNYTDTLERVYNIDRQRILYIHGKAAEGTKLILGHHDESYCNNTTTDSNKMSEAEYEEYCNDMMGRDFRVVEAEKIIKNYFKTTYKDTKKIVMQNKMFFSQLYDCKKVFILGHSLSYIDYEYFQAVRYNTPSDCMWFISYYSSNDYDNALKLVESLQIQHYKIAKTL